MTNAPTSAPSFTRTRQGPRPKPGVDALVHIGERRMDTPRITLIEYDEQVCTVQELPNLKEAKAHCRTHDDRNTVVWVNIDGLHDAAFIEELGRVFGLHQLVLEDVMNVGQRPKLEEYEDCLFCVLKMVDVDNATGKVMMEQISIVLGAGFVLTFQERDGDVFDSVRDRIKLHKGKLRKMGSDFLAYSLVDAIVDNYLLVLDNMTDLVDNIEQQIYSLNHQVNVHDIYMLKRELLMLRRWLLPAREVVGQLARHDESALINATVAVYFRDVHDHSLQVGESLETSREMLASLLDAYHSSQGNRLNEVMRVLTVISTIFMPITFIAGVYGMNFENMPELKSQAGYFACLGVMLVVAVALIGYMKKHRWL